MGAIISLSDIVAGARQHINDGIAHHLYEDEISDQIDGYSKSYILTNRNLVNIASGAPLNPTAIVNNVVVAATFDLVNGIITFSIVPNAGDVVKLRFYFELMSDAEYVEYAQGLQTFLGFPFTTNASGRWSGIADITSSISTLFTDAVTNFVASKAAGQMANLSGWWYRANDGDKSFDKAAVSAHFKDMAIDLKNEAEFARDGIYTRQGSAEAPASGVSRMRPLFNPQPLR